MAYFKEDPLTPLPNDGIAMMVETCMKCLTKYNVLGVEVMGVFLTTLDKFSCPICTHIPDPINLPIKPHFSWEKDYEGK